MGKPVLELFKKKWGIVLVAVILVAAAVLAVVFLLLPGKSAREFYFNAESKNYKRVSDWVKKSYQDFEKAQEPYQTGNYERRIETTADIKPGGGSLFGIKNPQGIFDIVGRCKLIVDTKHSPADSTAYSKLSLLLEKNPFIDADVFSNKKQLYFTVPILTPDRYFTLNEDKIDEVYDRFGIPVKPKRVLSTVDIAKTLKLDEKEMDSSAGSFGTFFTGMITDSDVKYGMDNVKVSVAGKEVAGREVLVTLDSGKSSALLKGLAQKAGGDDTLINLTYGNSADISGLLGEAGLYRLFDYLDKSHIVALDEGEKRILAGFSADKNAEGFKKIVSGAFDGYEFPEGIKMRLVIDKSGNILDRTIDTVVEDKVSLGKYNASIHTGVSSLLFDDCRNRFIDVTLESAASNGQPVKQHFNVNVSFIPHAGTDDEKGSVGLQFSVEAGGKTTSSTAVSLDFDSSTDKLTLKKDNALKYSVQMQGGASDAKGVLSGSINTVSWKNNKMKTKDWDTTLTLDADLPTFGIKGFSSMLTFAGEDKFGIGPITLPEVKAANTTDLNTATDEDLNKVEDEIMASFGTFYITNKPIIDAVTGK